MRLKLYNGMDRDTMRKNRSLKNEFEFFEALAKKNALNYEKNRSGCVGISHAPWRKPYNIPGIDLFFKKTDNNIESPKQYTKKLNNR